MVWYAIYVDEGAGWLFLAWAPGAHAADIVADSVRAERGAPVWAQSTSYPV